MEYMNYYMQLLDIDCKGTTFFLDIQTYVYKKGWHVYKKRFIFVTWKLQKC
jgi:hypothetical protein